MSLVLSRASFTGNHEPDSVCPDRFLTHTGSTSAPAGRRSHLNAAPLRPSELTTDHLRQSLMVHVKSQFHVERSTGSFSCHVGSLDIPTRHTTDPR